MRPKSAATALAFTLALALSTTVAPVWVVPAHAEAATQTRANQIEAALQQTFGKTPGVISVTPEGDLYKLRIDPAPLLADLPEGVKVSISPIIYTLTDQGNGQWRSKLDQKDFTFDVAVKDTLDQKVTVGEISSTGVYDENMSAFATSSSTMTGITMQGTNYTRGHPDSKVDYKIARWVSETRAKPGADGVDATNQQSLAGLTETITMLRPPAADGTERPGMPFTVTLDTMTQKADVTGLKTDGIIRIIRWFVDHPDKASRDAAKAELGPVVNAALPIFGKITGSATGEGLKVDTPMGTFAADKLGADVALNGVVADGRVSEGIWLEGLHTPPGIIPPFAEPLVPNRVAFDFELSQFDLAAPAKILLGLLESGESPDSPEMKDKLGQAVLPTGRIKVATRDTAVIGADYALHATGNLSAGPKDARPDMDFNITASGFDAILKAVDGFPPQMKQQAVPVLMLARGFAKTEANGTLSWAIQTSPDGHLLINGQDMGPMGPSNR